MHIKMMKMVDLKTIPTRAMVIILSYTLLKANMRG